MEHEVNKAASAFQMDHISVSDFRFVKPPTPGSFNGPVNIHSNGVTSTQFSEEEKKWHGTVSISLLAGNPDEAAASNSFSVGITLHAFFSFAADHTPENQELFTRLLRTNGAFSVFSTMRGMVAAATSALGLSPGFVTPFWNLENYKWDDLSSNVKKG